MDFHNLFTLEGRVALITGGSRGIGRMLLAGFLAAGCARVYVTARKVAQLEEVAAAFGADHPGRVVALPGDISRIEGIDALAAEIARREPQLDILVNNAGAAWGAEFDQFPEGAWDKVMELNVRTPFFLTQKLHPLLKAAARAERPAKVIMIASIDGLRINPWETYPYQASKAGLIHLTRRMAVRLIKDHIVVSGIAPGAFASDMNKAARDQADKVGRGIPAGRIGTAEDIAAGAIYLASRAGDYVVGTTLPIDGGMVNADIPDHFHDPLGN